MKDDRSTENLEIARLTDYVTGELTPADSEATRQWIADKKDHSAVVNDFEQARAAIQGFPGQHAESPETQRVMNAVFARIQPGSATALANNDQQATISAPRSASVRKTWITPRFGIWAIIAGLFVFSLVGLPVIDKIRTFQTETKTSSSETTPEFIARPGELVTVTLIDGSRVTLAPGSRLRYNAGFGRQDRTVHLTGRGFFEIAPNTKIPFVVHAAHSAVQVLGTSFVVSAYPQDTSVQVVVRDGKVALRTSTTENAVGITLTAGDLGTLSRVGLVTVAHQVEVAQYTAWTERHLVFRKVQTAEIVRELELRYGIEISMDPSFESVLMTVSFDKESADEALELLALGLRAKIVRSNTQYRITP